MGCIVRKTVGFDRLSRDHGELKRLGTALAPSRGRQRRASQHRRVCPPSRQVTFDKVSTSGPQGVRGTYMQSLGRTLGYALAGVVALCMAAPPVAAQPSAGN